MSKSYFYATIGIVNIPLPIPEFSEAAAYEFGALEAAMRQLDIMYEVKAYLKEYPDAVVVNLGCGLDQTGRACDNGRCRIVNIDFPV